MTKKNKNKTKKKNNTNNNSNNKSPSAASMIAVAPGDHANLSLNSSVTFNSTLNRSRGSRSAPRTPIDMAKTKDRLKEDVGKMGRQEKEDLMKMLTASLGADGGEGHVAKKINFTPSMSEPRPARDQSQPRKRKSGGDEVDQGAKRHKQMSTRDDGYIVEKVFLSGISEPIRKNGITFKEGILRALPNLKIKDIHFTRLGTVILSPATPQDHNKLIEEDWSKHSFLGSNVQASVERILEQGQVGQRCGIDCLDFH